jgi:DNA-binding transcriptional LysR family regulator
MELRHLRYFTAVARHLSFSAAARAIHVAQPALSETVQDLEAELGAQLLARTRQSVKLTAAGTVFLREAESILRAADEARRMAQQAARGETGRVAIGFLAPPTAPFLPALVREFRATRPGVEVVLLEFTPRELQLALAEGRIDLGFTRPVLDSAWRIPVQGETLFADALSAVIPRGHRLAKSTAPLPTTELRREDLVLVERDNAPWFYDMVIATCRRAGFSPRIVSSPDYMSTALLLVEAGTGCSIVPCSTAQHRRDLDIVFRRLTPQPKPVPLNLVWPKGDEAPAARAFRELVLARRDEIARRMEQRV